MWHVIHVLKIILVLHSLERCFFIQRTDEIKASRVSNKNSSLNRQHTNILITNSIQVVLTTTFTNLFQKLESRNTGASNPNQFNIDVANIFDL